MTRSDLIAIAVDAIWTSDDHAVDLVVSAAIIDAAVDGNYGLDEGEVELIEEAAAQKVADVLADNAARMGD
jgi:hypothetical protein